MAEPPELPWVYPYSADTQSSRPDDEVLRPFVPMSLAAGDQATAGLQGLVDTGANPIFASRVAQSIAIEQRDTFDERFGPTFA